MTTKDLSEVFAQAAELAEAVPERYRDRAFELAVRQALGEIASPGQLQPVSPKGRKPTQAKLGDTPGVEPWLARVFEGSPAPDAVADSGSRVHQAMFAVISLHRARQQANVEAVRRYIKEKLGTTPQSGSHTSDTLKSLVPRYLSRESAREGRGYEYTPTARALEVFSDLS